MNTLSSKEQLKQLLSDLDGRVRERIDLYIIGGANLIAGGFQGRETKDIDVISPPRFSQEFLKAIQYIAGKEGMEPDWLNTMPSRDERFLADGWKKRAILFYAGKYLKVFMISRIDMVGLKLAATLDRVDPDLEDLLIMNPTEEEWEFGRQWARQYDANPDWPEAIDRLVEELKRRQGG